MRLNTLTSSLDSDRGSARSFYRWLYSYWLPPVSLCDGWYARLSGDRTAWGISEFVGWLPRTRGYRHYRITDGGSDDYRSLTEVLTRYLHIDIPDDTTPLPDLIIIDGGIWQLHTVTQLMDAHPGLETRLSGSQIVSLGKWAARHQRGKIAWAKEQLLVLQQDHTITTYDLTYDIVDQVLIKCRNEAHRFANKYRTKQMSQERSTS
jgi:excinuclease UvrABC nuclease subunit